ncbi:hypothetical protein HDU67_002670 [Dinochytrium kinnereticum]|nr:hypothetical protein HDU67_002670 [Dinochytrium kinnereticum]
MISVDDIDYATIAWKQPTRTSAHPFIIINPDHGEAPTAVFSSSPSTACSVLSEVRPTVEPELFIHTDKSVDSLFIRRSDAVALGLRELGEEDTCYSVVQRFSPVIVVALSQSILVNDVFELPAAFSGTRYEEGVIGIPLLWNLGVTVAIDRGMVYLVQPHHLVPSPVEPDSGFDHPLHPRHMPIATTPDYHFTRSPRANTPSTRSVSPVSRKSVEVGPFSLEEDDEESDGFEDRVMDSGSA